MTKLKFDRLINLKLKADEKIVIPQGELWKVSLYQDANRKLNVNEVSPGYENIQNGLIVQGSEIKSIRNGATIQGIVFKVVENV